VWTGTSADGFVVPIAALRRQATKNVAAHASARQALLVQQHFIAVREFASKKDKGAWSSSPV
jgi:hypothetical protein